MAWRTARVQAAACVGLSGRVGPSRVRAREQALVPGREAGRGAGRAHTAVRRTSPAALQAHTADDDDRGCLEIRGGSRLEGELYVSGAKNSALALMAGCLLCAEQVVLHNVPQLRDIAGMTTVLQSLGVLVYRDAAGTMLVDASQLSGVMPLPEAVQALRASFLVLGPLLARCGHAQVVLPGGCAIGARPVDLHLQGLRALGASVQVQDGVVLARAPAHNGGAPRLVGGSVCLSFPSVGATETILMAATLADGETVLSNAAQEPEVVDLAHLLCAMGARIRGAGTSTIVVQGVSQLQPVEFTVIPDRIEAGTFLVAAAITRSRLTVGPVVAAHMAPLTAALMDTGCTLSLRGDRYCIDATASRGELRCTDVVTQPYPGFPTDMQPQMMALLATAAGTATVHETVFEGRMAHARELKRMGADITLLDGSSARINGLAETGLALQGCTVGGTDLRGTAALALAGLAAQHLTTVEGLHHLVRGYDGFDVKLRAVGADMRRIPLPPLLGCTGGSG